MCAYIKDRTGTTQYVVGDLTSIQYQRLLVRGWRRFGRFFFANACDGCTACENLRIDVKRFIWTRSFKRVLKNGENIRVAVRRPAISKEHLALFVSYHEERSRARGWESDGIGDLFSYHHCFCEGGDEFGFEFAYYLGNHLIGVALVDILPTGVSAVYCYYDPDYSHLSIGTFSILRQIMFAAENDIPYLYLGFCVRQNQSLNYKTRFKPYEILKSRPSLDEEPLWN